MLFAKERKSVALTPFGVPPAAAVWDFWMMTRLPTKQRRRHGGLAEDSPISNRPSPLPLPHLEIAEMSEVPAMLGPPVYFAGAASSHLVMQRAVCFAAAVLATAVHDQSWRAESS